MLDIWTVVVVLAPKANVQIVVVSRNHVGPPRRTAHGDIIPQPSTPASSQTHPLHNVRCTIYFWSAEPYKNQPSRAWPSNSVPRPHLISAILPAMSTPSTQTTPAPAQAPSHSSGTAQPQAAGTPQPPAAGAPHATAGGAEGAATDAAAPGTAPGGERYPEQKHAGAVGYGPNYQAGPVSTVLRFTEAGGWLIEMRR